ncbi:MAG: methyl-accepting chemotaxis protein, partial [Planctomycetota bacterium]
EQVSSSSHTLAQGATEQASSLEETSASMEEMSAMTKQNTQNAGETSKLVEVCTSAAEDGNKAAAEVSNAMGEITESSKKIAEITKVIDGIASQTNNLAVKAGQDTSQIIKQGNSFAVVAKEVRNLANKSTSAAKNTRTIVDGCIAFANEFENESDEHKEFRENIKKIARGIKDIESIAYQTNLLALNAAVEAARASDNGEKFAAVTEEVSNLAKKSASAAKDTTTLINECVQKAGNGTKVADKCKESMENIVKDVKRASALTREITEASSEQSEGINQVTQAVQQMDQVTQQAAASAEETASASEELASQAHTMQEQIDVLAKQVSGNDKVELSTHQPAKPGWDRLRLEGDVDQEIPCLASEQEIVIKKTTNNIVFKLFFSPIYILRYTLKKIFKVSEQDSANIGNKSGSAGGVTHTKDSTETVPGNGNDTENVLVGTASNDSVIPMGTGETKEHDNRFKDF